MSPRNATEIGQRRFYTWRGWQYPSVTTILKVGTPKEWLGAWAAKMVAETAITDLSAHGIRAVKEWAAADYQSHCETKMHASERGACEYVPDATRWLKAAPWRKRDAAAEVGSAVHAAAEAHSLGIPHPSKPEVEPFLPHLAQWAETYRPEILFTEGQIFNTEVGYAGSFDLIARVYGRTLLIDYKTGSVVDHFTALQLAAYEHGEFIGADDEVVAQLPALDGCAVLHLRPEGGLFMDVATGPEAWQDFLHVKAIADRVTKYGNKPPFQIILPQVEEAAA
jgi:hypothetical protein